MFRRGDIPKRLIPGTIALGAFTFTMDSLPGTPQIQNIIPDHVLRHGYLGGAAARRRSAARSFSPAASPTSSGAAAQALRAGEGYGSGSQQRAGAVSSTASGAHPLLAVLPLLVVGVANLCVHARDPACLSTGRRNASRRARAATGDAAVRRSSPSGQCMGALLAGIVTVLVFAFRPVIAKFAEGTKNAVGGALLASMNTASEYGFGAVIAALPGFLVIKQRADGDSRSAGQRSDHRHDARRHHRLGFRRTEHRAGCDVGAVHDCRAELQAFPPKCCTASRRWRAAAWIRCRTTAP